MAENKPHPGMAAVLSFVFNGLGQIYNGQIKKGLFIISLSAVCMLLMIIGGVFTIIALAKGFLLSRQVMVNLGIFVLGVITATLLGIYSIFDAYNTAKKLSE